MAWVVIKSLFLLNEWELRVVLSTKLSNWKEMASFLARAFPLSFAVKVLQKRKMKKYFFSCFFLCIWYTYMYGEFYTKNYRNFFFIPLNDVGMKLPKWEGNEHVISCSLLNPVLFWNSENNMGTQNLLQKTDFPLSPFSLN